MRHSQLRMRRLKQGKGYRDEGAKAQRGSKATLVEQPHGKELEYRIIAVNKAGDGKPFNTAMIVL